MKLYSIQVGTEKFQIDDLEHRHLQGMIARKEKGMFATSSGSFLIERVNSIKPLNFVDYKQPETKREYVSDEQRRKNARRMRIAKLWMLQKANRPLVISPEDQTDFDKFNGWMSSPAKQERIRMHSAFQTEFFDVYFENEQEREYCYQSWLPYHDGSRDPREFNREEHTPEALGLREENSLVKAAAELFT